MIFGATIRSGGVPNIRLTCKMFALLGKPMAFRCFIFYPLVIWRGNPLLPVQKAIARDMKHLEFWASDEISCHVREIRLSHTSEVSPLKADKERLLDAFFDFLPNFINVQTFKCWDVSFDDFALRQLCRLDNLQTLDLHRTSVIAAAPARAALRLNSLKYTAGENRYHSVAENFLSFLAATQTMRCVTEILVPHSDALIRLLVSALSCVTSSTLKRLELARSFNADNEPLSNLGSVLVPSLHTYIGPHQFLLSFVPGNAIHTLYLSGLGGNVFSDPNSLVDTLRCLPSDSIANLTKLSVGVTRLTQDVLDIICSRCFQLRSLSFLINPIQDVGVLVGQINSNQALEVNLAFSSLVKYIERSLWSAC
jgi:hypothetical protein